jgi:hypothetical protein
MILKLISNHHFVRMLNGFNWLCVRSSGPEPFEDGDETSVSIRQRVFDQKELYSIELVILRGVCTAES